MFKLSLLTPLPSLPTPHPPPSVVHQPSHTCSLCPSCYCSLFHAFCPCFSHIDIPVPLTPFINWVKTNRASLIPLNQHETDNPFLFPCNHVTIHTQTTKIDCNLLFAFVSDFLFFFPSFFTVEEESMESGSFSVGQRSTSGRSSFSSENAGDDYNSLKKKKAKDKKIGGGLLGFLR